MYKTRNLPNTRIDVADALRGIAAALRQDVRYLCHALRLEFLHHER